MSLPVPEYMKIRQYVVNLVSNADGQPVKIMSERALCGKFHVARGTVRKALEDLIKEEYLVPRRGMGTFVNPRKSAEYRVRMSRKVGVIMSSGMLVNISCEYQLVLSGVFDVFAKHDVSVQLVNFAARDYQDIFQDLTALGFDGLLWLYPSPCNMELVDYFAERMDSLVLLVSCRRSAWKHVVLNDYKRAMLAGVARLIEHAGADVVFVGRNDEHPEVLELFTAFEGLFAERNLKRPVGYSIAADRIDKTLPHLLRARHPKALYSQGGEFGRAAMEALRREARHLPADFIFLCQDAPEMEMLPANIRILRIPPPDFRQQGRESAKMLLEVMEKIDAAPARPVPPRVVKVARRNLR